MPKKGEILNPKDMFCGARIPNSILRLPETKLSARDKCLYARLLQFACDDEICSPKQRELAEELGVSRSTITRCIRALEHFGVLKVIRPEGNALCQHLASRYLFLWHPIFEVPTTQSDETESS